MLVRMMLARRTMLRTTWVLAVVCLAAGCLSDTYTIDRNELARLSRTPPDDRGLRVRATQDLSFSSEPPPAEASPPLRTDVELTVALSIAAGTHHHPSPHRQAVAVSRPGEPGGAEGSTGGGESEGSSSEGGDGDGGGADVALAVVMVAASAGIGVALAVTEGSRYDGWLALGREHPVHLEGPNGEEVWVPLAGLDPGLAEWATEARISELEGPTTLLGRAPLDRQGLTFGFELGLAETGSVDRTGSLGFASRTTFGWFPIHEIGVLAGLGVGVTGQTVEWRPHLELQAYPLAIDRFHAGLYVQGGYAAGSEDVADGPNASLDGWYWGGGGLVQIDVTTRLAITFRGGVAVLTDPGETMVAPEGLIGIAVY